MTRPRVPPSASLTANSLAGAGPGQQQVGEIDRRDQQHQRRDRHQDPQRTLIRVAQRRHAAGRIDDGHPHLLIQRGPIGAELGHGRALHLRQDALDVRLCLRRGLSRKGRRAEREREGERQ